MAVGIQLGDFVGYNVGTPHVVPPATVGFVGMLDFTGLPVGMGTAPPIPVITRTTIAPAYSDARFRRRLRREDEEIIILS